jgi:hypothetical protein
MTMPAVWPWITEALLLPPLEDPEEGVKEAEGLHVYRFPVTAGSGLEGFS